MQVLSPVWLLLGCLTGEESWAGRQTWRELRMMAECADSCVAGVRCVCVVGALKEHS